MLPNDLSASTKNQDHRSLDGYRQPHLGRHRDLSHRPAGLVGKLENLPALVEQIDGGPAILIIGDVVAHSAPWRQSNLNQVLSKLLDAAE